MYGIKKQICCYNLIYLIHINNFTLSWKSIFIKGFMNFNAIFFKIRYSSFHINLQRHPLSGNTIYSLNFWLFCCFFFYYALLLLVGIFFFSFAFLCSFLFMFFFLKIFLKNNLVILLLVLYFIKIKLLPEFSIYCYCFPSVFIVLFHFMYLL